MHLGIDLDNTIIRYDQVFHDVAVAQGWIDAAVPATRRAVRAAMRALPDGVIWWTRLQGLVYGPHLAQAEPAPGVLAFIAECHRRGIPLSVVSHKSRHPTQGPRVDLHDAALAWLEHHFFRHAGDYGLMHSRVYFEPDQAAKARRIGALACTHLIDDLPEFLAHPLLSSSLHRLWYAPDPGEESAPGAQAFRSWPDIHAWFAKTLAWTPTHANF